MALGPIAQTLIVVLLGLIAAFLLLAYVTRGPYRIPGTVSSDPTLPVLELNRVRLHGKITGPKAAPLVIVLHGGPGNDHRSLLGLETLSDRYRVLFFDQRGAGLSERVASDALSMADYLSDLDALVDAYSNGQDIHLVGHSWGAILAIAYLGHRPDRVGRVVAIEPGFLDFAGYQSWEKRRKSIARSPRLLMTGLVAGFRSRQVTPIDPHAAEDYLVGSVVHAFANHPDNPYHCPGKPYSAPSWRFGAQASDVFWSNPEPNLEAVAAGVGQPTPILFIAGGCNEWTGPMLQTRHAQMFPNASVKVIANAGHDSVWDQPDETIDAIRDFLNRHE